MLLFNGCLIQPPGTVGVACSSNTRFELAYWYTVTNIGHFVENGVILYSFLKTLQIPNTFLPIFQYFSSEINKIPCFLWYLDSSHRKKYPIKKQSVLFENS